VGHEEAVEPAPSVTGRNIRSWWLGDGRRQRHRNDHDGGLARVDEAVKGQGGGLRLGSGGDDQQSEK
jgi:hypothetical protein